MLQVQFLREEKETVLNGLKKKNFKELSLVDDAISIDDARKAICLALNDEEIVDAAYGAEELARTANSLLTPDQSLYNKDCKGYEQNLEEAKALAKSSGLEGIPKTLF